MARFEEQLRTSLHRRAGDVEATSALWPEVNRRISRRRGAVAASWSLATAATALVAVLAIPVVLDSTAQPEIGPVEEAPQPPAEERPTEDPATSSEPPLGEVAGEISSGATLPAGIVLAEGEGLSVVDLPSGDRTILPAPDGDLLDLAARPGAAPGNGLEIAYTAATERAGYHRVGVIDETGEDRVVTEIPSGEAVRPTVVWSPDGEWLAWSRGAGETHIGLSRIAGPVGSTPAGSVIHSSSPDSPHAQGALSEGLVLTDWALDGPPGLQLFGAHVDGYAVTMATDLDETDGSEVGIAQGQSLPMVEGLLARVDAAPERDGTRGGYSLTGHDGELELVWTTPDGSVGLPWPDDAGDGPFDLDAVSDAVVLGDGHSAWLVTHDGDGGDPRVADLGEATAVSLIREAAAG